MRWFVAIVLILSVFSGYAYAQMWEYDPPMFPGDSGTMRGPGGQWTYDPPGFRGDYGTWRGPGGGYTVDPPAFPGDSWTIRKTY